MWTDVAGFWVSVAVAVGTIGAVVVSLYATTSGRRREREAVTRSAALGLLDVLADLHQVLPMMPVSRQIGKAVAPGREQWAAAMEKVDRALLAVVPLTTVETQQRWSDLKFLLFELSAAGAPQDTASGPDEWTSIKIARARQDVEAYIAYVRESVLAVADGRKLPPTVKAPYLRRSGNEVWSVDVRS